MDTDTNKLFFEKEPIIVSVDTSNIAATTLASVTVKLTIEGHEYPFEDDFKKGVMNFDVSSAFIAEFLKQEAISPDHPSYELLTGTFIVNLSYLDNGEIENRTIVESTKIGPVARGGRSEATRWQGVDVPSQNLSFKPSTGEVIGHDEKYILPGVNSSEFLENVPSSVYVNQDSDRHTFAFINSFGLLESASAEMLESKDYKISSTLYNKVGEVSTTPQARIRSKKSGGNAEWKMSSGFNTKEWLEWWTTEFLTSSEHWLFIGDKWLPVVVTPEETTSVYNRSRGELLAVNFSVKSAMEGRIKN